MKCEEKHNHLEAQFIWYFTATWCDVFHKKSIEEFLSVHFQTTDNTYYTNLTEDSRAEVMNIVYTLWTVNCVTASLARIDHLLVLAHTRTKPLS